MLFMSWFPQGSDSVAWRASLLTRSYPFLNITGVNPASVGITALRSIDEGARDGLNSPNSGAPPLPLLSPAQRMLSQHSAACAFRPPMRPHSSRRSRPLSL